MGLNKTSTIGRWPLRLATGVLVCLHLVQTHVEGRPSNLNHHFDASNNHARNSIIGRGMTPQTEDARNLQSRFTNFFPLETDGKGKGKGKGKGSSKTNNNGKGKGNSSKKNAKSESTGKGLAQLPDGSQDGETEPSIGQSGGKGKGKGSSQPLRFCDELDFVDENDEMDSIDSSSKSSKSSKSDKSSGKGKGKGSTSEGSDSLSASMNERNDSGKGKGKGGKSGKAANCVRRLPSTARPTTTTAPSVGPTTEAPTGTSQTPVPTIAPTTILAVTLSPTETQATSQPTVPQLDTLPPSENLTTDQPTMLLPTEMPTTDDLPTLAPTDAPLPTSAPTNEPLITPMPTDVSLTTEAPTREVLMTQAPTDGTPATDAPTPAQQTTDSPTQAQLTTDAPTQAQATTAAPTQAQGSTDAPTQAQAATDAPTQSQAMTDSPTQAQVATDVPTQVQATTDSPSQAQATTDAPTQPQMTTDAPSQAQATTDAPTQPQATTNAPTQSQAATDAPTQSQATTDAPSQAQVATDTPTSAQVATDAPTQPQITTDAPSQSQVATDAPSQAQVSTDAPTQAQVATDAPTSAQVATDAPTQSQVTTDAPTQAQAMTDSPTQPQAMTDSPTQPQVATDAPTQAQVSTNAPTQPQVTTDSPTQPQVATDAPTQTQVSTDAPTQPQVTTDSPTQPQITTDAPTQPQVTTDTPTQPQVTTDAPTEGPVVTTEMPTSPQPTTLSPTVSPAPTVPATLSPTTTMSPTITMSPTNDPFGEETEGIEETEITIGPIPFSVVYRLDSVKPEIVEWHLTSLEGLTRTFLSNFMKGEFEAGIDSMQDDSTTPDDAISRRSLIEEDIDADTNVFDAIHDFSTSVVDFRVLPSTDNDTKDGISTIQVDFTSIARFINPAHSPTTQKLLNGLRTAFSEDHISEYQNGLMLLGHSNPFSTTQSAQLDLSEQDLPYLHPVHQKEVALRPFSLLFKMDKTHHELFEVGVVDDMTEATRIYFGHAVMDALNGTNATGFLRSQLEFVDVKSSEESSEGDVSIDVHFVPKMYFAIPPTPSASLIPARADLNAIIAQVFREQDDSSTTYTKSLKESLPETSPFVTAESVTFMHESNLPHIDDQSGKEVISVRLPSYMVQFILSSTAEIEPESKYLQDLTALTDSYMRAFITARVNEQYDDVIIISIATEFEDHVVRSQEVSEEGRTGDADDARIRTHIMIFRTKVDFSATSPRLIELAELDHMRKQAFRGESLTGYMSMLNQLPGDNPFSSVVSSDEEVALDDETTDEPELSTASTKPWIWDGEKWILLGMIPLILSCIVMGCAVYLYKRTGETLPLVDKSPGDFISEDGNNGRPCYRDIENNSGDDSAGDNIAGEKRRPSWNKWKKADGSATSSSSGASPKIGSPNMETGNSIQAPEMGSNHSRISVALPVYDSDTSSIYLGSDHNDDGWSASGSVEGLHRRMKENKKKNEELEYLDDRDGKDLLSERRRKQKKEKKKAKKSRGKKITEEDSKRKSNKRTPDSSEEENQPARQSDDDRPVAHKITELWKVERVKGPTEDDDLDVMQLEGIGGISIPSPSQEFGSA